MVLVSPAVYPPLPSIDCTQSISGDYLGCVPFMVTPPPGMIPKSEQTVMTLHMSLPPSSDVHLTGLWHDIPMGSLHMVPQWWCHHRCYKLFTTYPCPIPLPERGFLYRHPPFVRRLNLLTLDESRGAYHQLCLLKHSYKHCHCLLHPDGVLTRDAVVVSVEQNVMFAWRPTQPVLRLLRTSYF